MMWWNGEPLPTPSPGISFEERIVEGTNSGQTLGGSYSKKIIARKEDVRVTWEGLTAEEIFPLRHSNKTAPTCPHQFQPVRYNAHICASELTCFLGGYTY